MTENADKKAERLEKEAHLLEEDAAGLEEKAHAEEKEAHQLEKEAHRLEVEERRDHDNHGGDEPGDAGELRHGHFVEITMVVNGQPVEIKATESERLSEVRQKALVETQNLAQPPENWEIKNEAGDVLDPDKTVGSFHFGEKVTLFLSLKAGAAGA